MKMKKLLALLLVLCMTVSLLPGTAIAAGETVDPSATPEAQSSAEPTATPAATATASAETEDEAAASAEPAATPGASAAADETEEKTEAETEDEATAETTATPAASAKPTPKADGNEALTEKKAESQIALFAGPRGEQANRDSSESKTIKIYIYTKIGGDLAGLGLTKNTENWYTLGFVEYPVTNPEQFKNPDQDKKLNNIKDTVVNYALSNSGSVTRYKDNQIIDLADVTFDNLWWKDGASDYVGNGKGIWCLHLDGTIDATKHFGSVTYKYVDSSSKTLTDNVTTPYPAGETLTFGIDGAGYKSIITAKNGQKYVYVGVETDKNPLTVEAGKKYTVTYKYAKASELAQYTIHHYLKGTMTKVAEDITGYAKIGSSVTATAASSLKFAGAQVYGDLDTIEISKNSKNEITVYYTVPLTLTAASNEWEYDGKEHSDDNFKVDGYVNDDNAEKIKVELSMTAGSKVKDVGEEESNKINESTIEINSKSLENGIYNYYRIVCMPGTLKIKQISKEVFITITGKTDTKVYNGTVQSVSGFDYTVPEGVNKEDITVELKPGSKAEASGTSVSTYQMMLKADNFVIDSVKYAKVTIKEVIDGSLTIERMPLTITAGSKDRVYDGTPLTENSYTNSALAEGDKITSVTVTGSQTDVGTSYNVASNAAIMNAEEKTVTLNYNITYVDGKLEVTPVADEVTVTIKGNTDTMAYDGKEHTVRSYTTDVGDRDITVTLKSTGKDSVTATNVIAENGGKYPMGLTKDDFTVTSKTYSNIKVVVVDGWLQITPRPVTVQMNDNEAIYDGMRHDAQRDETGALVEGKSYTIKNNVEGEGLLAGHSLKEIGVTGGEVHAGTYPLIPTVSGIVDGDKNDVSDNYYIRTESGTLTIKKAAPITITITGNTNTVTYSGTEQSVSGFTDDAPESFTVTLKDGSKAEAAGIFANENPYMMNLTKDDFDVKPSHDDYEEVIVTVKDGWLKINPVTEKVVVTIKGHTDSVVYDGIQHSVTGYDIIGSSNTLYHTGVENVALADGKAARAEGTDAKTYPMGLSSDSFVNKNANFTNVIFDVTDGWLEITPVTAEIVVTIVGNTDTQDYSGFDWVFPGGSELLYKVTNISGSELYNESCFKLKDGVNQKVSGKNAGQYDLGLSSDSFENTNKNFTNVKFVVTDGWLKINPVAIELTAASDKKVYDGKALTNGGYSVTPADNGFKATEGLESVTVEGSQTNAGSSENKITGYKLKEGTLAQNYSITVKPGTLTVTPAEKAVVKITGRSATEIYNGTAKTVEGFTAAAGTDPTITVALKPGKTAKATGTNVGTYPMGLTANDFTATSLNYKEIAIEYTDGALKINPNQITVTITGSRGTVAYDGKEHTVRGYTTDVTDNTITVQLLNANADTARGTEPGTYNMGLKAADFRVLSANYTNIKVVVVDGYLTIEPGNTPVPTQTPDNEPTPAPTQAPTQAPEIEEIDENETPEAGYGAAWALINLICAILTVVFSVLLLVGLAGKNEKTEENDAGEEVEKEIKKKKFWRIFSIVPALAAVIVFLLTENMRLPMVLVDRWTLLMVIIALVQVLVMVFGKKTTKDPEEEAQA